MDPSQSKRLSWLRVSTTVAFVVCALFASTVRLSGDDFWLQAKIGEIIAQTHAIPRTLLFPFTEVATDTFNAHEWLMSIAFHYALSILGEDGMPILIGGLGLLLFTLIARLSYFRSGSNFAFALLGGFIGLLAENYRHVLRPELPSLIFMALLWNVIERYKARPSVGLASASGVIIVFWVNSHGSFVLGPVLVGIYACGIFLDDLRISHWRVQALSPTVQHFLWLLLVVSLSCLINPFGLEMIRFVFSFSTDAATRVHLTEWLPTFDPRLHEVRGFWIALFIWCGVATAVALGRRRLSCIDWLVFATFTFLAYRAIRFPVYLGLVAAYLLPACLPPDWRARNNEGIFLRVGMGAALVSLAAMVLWGNASASRPYSSNDKTKFTPAMVQVLDNPDLQGNVLNSMEFGAELVYRTYPRLRPSIDCRFDSYGVDYSLFNDALFRDDALLREFVSRYDVRYLLMNMGQIDRFKELASWKEGKWRVYFFDQYAALLQRSDVVQGTPAL